jgi:hypothetical protein
MSARRTSRRIASPHRREHAIAHVVTEAIVHVLEEVDVDQGERVADAQVEPLLDARRQLAQEVVLRAQPGLRVDVDLAHLLGDHLLVREVEIVEEVEAQDDLAELHLVAALEHRVAHRVPVHVRPVAPAEIADPHLESAAVVAAGLDAGVLARHRALDELDRRLRRAPHVEGEPLAPRSGRSSPVPRRGSP